jgi:hypothetical protein
LTNLSEDKISGNETLWFQAKFFRAGARRLAKKLMHRTQTKQIAVDLPSMIVGNAYNDACSSMMLQFFGTDFVLIIEILL